MGPRTQKKEQGHERRTCLGSCPRFNRARAQPSELSLCLAGAQEPLTSFWPPSSLGLLERYGGLASFVFAYQGQSMFLEIMKEMRQPAEFGRAVWAANGGMGLVYALTVVLAYGAHGRQVAGFLPASLPPGLGRRVAGLLLCYHIGVSYLLCFQPLGEKIHNMAFPDTAALPNTRCALRARAAAAAAAASLTALPPAARPSGTTS